MSTIRYWLHCDLSTTSAHLIAVTEPLSRLAQDPSLVTGFAYRKLPELQDFLGHAVEVTHGDADAILMGAEMQGRDEVWLDIDADAFDRIMALGNIMGCERRAISGYKVVNDQAFVITGDELEPEISESLEDAVAA